MTDDWILVGRSSSHYTRVVRIVAAELGVSYRFEPIYDFMTKESAVFAIDIETCRQCGGRLRVIASIEAPAVIEWILEHLGRDAESIDPAYPSRVPPERDLSI